MSYKCHQSLEGAVKQTQYFLVIFVHFLYFKIFIIVVCRYGFLFAWVSMNHLLSEARRRH